MKKIKMEKYMKKEPRRDKKKEKVLVRAAKNSIHAILEPKLNCQM